MLRVYDKIEEEFSVNKYRCGISGWMFKLPEVQCKNLHQKCEKQSLDVSNLFGMILETKMRYNEELNRYESMWYTKSVSDENIAKIRKDIFDRTGLKPNDYSNGFAVPFVRFANDIIYIGLYYLENGTEICELELFDCCYGFDEYVSVESKILRHISNSND